MVSLTGSPSLSPFPALVLVLLRLIHPSIHPAHSTCSRQLKSVLGKGTNERGKSYNGFPSVRRVRPHPCASASVTASRRSERKEERRRRKEHPLSPSERTEHGNEPLRTLLFTPSASSQLPVKDQLFWGTSVVQLPASTRRGTPTVPTCPAHPARLSYHPFTPFQIHFPSLSLLFPLSREFSHSKVERSIR